MIVCLLGDYISVYWKDILGLLAVLRISVLLTALKIFAPLGELKRRLRIVGENTLSSRRTFSPVRMVAQCE